MRCVRPVPVACSEAYRLGPIHADDGASHPPSGGRRARRLACLLSPLVQRDERGRARHLHAAMHRPQEHCVSTGSACTSLYLTAAHARTDPLHSQPLAAWRAVLRLLLNSIFFKSFLSALNCTSVIQLPRAITMVAAYLLSQPFLVLMYKYT